MLVKRNVTVPDGSSVLAMLAMIAPASSTPVAARAISSGRRRTALGDLAGAPDQIDERVVGGLVDDDRAVARDPGASWPGTVKKRRGWKRTFS